LALLFVNAIIGFVEERNAGNALESLKNSLASNAVVLREGHWSTIPARELVPGDVIRVKLGDIVPADGLMARGEYLSVDQSALTGAMERNCHLFGC
jgi:H+-transporting ATPase